ncbi:MAG TPA: hypothetical protein VEQ59_06150 [Polyangiaceae bacterium]|nr:hypothetical protein [Polyangiaceae bacterium]
MKLDNWAVMAAMGLAFWAGGCSGKRDVEVSGELKAASNVSVGNRLVVDFFDVLPEGSEGATPDQHRVVLGSLGEFEQTVSLEADQVDIRALDDKDGDGLCSAGEAWGRASAPIEQDKASGVTLVLEEQTCWALDE